MQRLLIDASAWTQALRPRGDEKVRELVVRHLETDSAAWCDITRLELWAGVRGAAEQAMLRKMESRVIRVPLTAAMWDAAVELAAVAQTVGLHVPGPDLAVFACAKLSGLPLLHRDKHFDLLENLGA